MYFKIGVIILEPVFDSIEKANLQRLKDNSNPKIKIKKRRQKKNPKQLYNMDTAYLVNFIEADSTKKKRKKKKKKFDDSLEDIIDSSNNPIPVNQFYTVEDVPSQNPFSRDTLIDISSLDPQNYDVYEGVVYPGLETKTFYNNFMEDPDSESEHTEEVERFKCVLEE